MRAASRAPTRLPWQYPAELPVGVHEPSPVECAHHRSLAIILNTPGGTRLHCGSCSASFALEDDERRGLVAKISSAYTSDVALP